MCRMVKAPLAPRIEQTPGRPGDLALHFCAEHRLYRPGVKLVRTVSVYLLRSQGYHDLIRTVGLHMRVFSLALRIKRRLQTAIRRASADSGARSTPGSVVRARRNFLRVLRYPVGFRSCVITRKMRANWRSDP